MVDSRISKFAKVLTHYCLNLKKGDLLYIEGNILSESLMTEAYKEALLLGANISIVTQLEAAPEILLRYGSDEQIAFPNPVDKMLIEQADARLTIWGSANNKSLINIDSSKLRLRAAGRKDIMKTYTDRMNSGALRWCGTQFPTHAAAMDADMSLTEYEDFVFAACHLDCEDPIAKWLEISKLQQKYVDYLNTKSAFEVKSKDTHLTFNAGGRKWINCDGRVNFPDGEVFTSPIEDTMNGHVRFSYPAIYMGNEVEDVELTFKDGKVVSAKAKKGEAFLQEILKTDDGASFVGEFAIGTNYDIQHFTKNMLFDEKIGGTIHMAVGASAGDAGGKNISAIHWDMLADMKENGEIYADGELFYKNGQFLI